MAFYELTRQVLENRLSPALPGIPEPTDGEPARSIRVLKQGYEQLARTRGDVSDSALRVGDIPSLLDVLFDDTIDVTIYRDDAQRITRCDLSLDNLGKKYRFDVTLDDAGNIHKARGRLL